MVGCKSDKNSFVTQFADYVTVVHCYSVAQKALQSVACNKRELIL